jgi:DNA polymerase III epsilon subunit-like protein
MKFCFIDCETTGTDKKKHGLIQFAGKIVVDGKIVDSFNITAAPFPDDVIDAEALAVNGLTEMIIRSYQTPKAAYRQFIDIISKHCDRYHRQDKMHFTGWNADFDADFVREFFEKNGDPYFGSWFWYPILDVSKLAGLQLAPRRHEMVNFRLTQVAHFLQVDVDEAKAHDAMYDIDLTMRIFLFLTKSLSNLGLEVELT